MTHWDATMGSEELQAKLGEGNANGVEWMGF